jgi:hypothetical protein
MWISLKTLPTEYMTMEAIVASKVGVFLGVNPITFVCWNLRFYVAMDLEHKKNYYAKNNILWLILYNYKWYKQQVQFDYKWCKQLI